MILDCYASAIHSSNLRSVDKTTYSDSDVLGAVGLASKRNALSLALARLFAGDNRASREIVSALSELAWGKAKALRIELKRFQADDMARMVLAWHRDGVCRPCGGHGYAIISGTRSIGDTECQACRGTRKAPFDRQFPADQREVAAWLVAEVEREQGKAGPAAMAKLAALF